MFGVNPWHVRRSQLSSCPAARKKLNPHPRISDEWQLSRLKSLAKGLDLTLEVYRRTRDFPRLEFNELSDQMRRAAVSIASNIAEGKGRSTDRDFAYFLCHARGSLYELETQAVKAQELGYLSEDAVLKLCSLSAETGKMLKGR